MKQLMLSAVLMISSFFVGVYTHPGKLPTLDQNKRLPVVVQSSLGQARIAYHLSEEQLHIVKAQCDLDVKNAELDIKLAQTELKKYLECDYKQRIEQLTEDISMAKIDRLRAMERYAWAQRMLAKNYFGPTYVNVERDTLKRVELKVASLERELASVKDYQANRNILDLQNKVSKTKCVLENVKQVNAAKIQQATLDRDHKKREFEERNNISE